MQAPLTQSPARGNIQTVIVTLVVFLGLGFLLTLSLEGSIRDRTFQEGGIVESLSVIGYLVCLGQIFFLGGRHFCLTHYYIPTLITLLCLRELDFHDRFTTMGIFKSRFYSSAEVPVIEKCIGALVIIVLISIVVALLRNHSAEFLKGIRRGAWVPLCTLVAIGLAGVAKSLDGIKRKLEPIGLTISEQTSKNFAAMEEVMELGIPLALMVALYIHIRSLD